MIKQRKNANPPVKRVCITCSEDFFIPPSILKYRSGKYCSAKCRVRTGKHNPKWRGGKIKRDGYIYIYTPEHPNATKQGYVCEHRLVMEEKLNRLLTKKEHVHHINENRADNRVENLVVLTHKQHLNIHLRGKKQTPEHVRNRFANRKPHDMSKYERNSKGQFIHQTTPI